MIMIKRNDIVRELCWKESLHAFYKPSTLSCHSLSRYIKHEVTRSINNPAGGHLCAQKVTPQFNPPIHQALIFAPCLISADLD